MNRLQKSRMYVVHCATGEAITAAAGRAGMRARYALCLAGGERSSRVAGGRAKSVFDSVEGGCLSLKRS